MVRVKVPIKGGLGNQMFGYAYSLFLKSKGYQVVLLWRDYMFTKQHNGVELERAFNIKLSSREKRALKVYYSFNRLFQNRLLKIIISKLVNECDKLFNKTVYLQKSPFDFQEPTFFNDTIANGFWQNCNYLDPIRADILRCFSFILPEGYDKNSIIGNIKETESVAIHIRRGDYQNKEFLEYNIFGENTNFQQKAIAWVKEKLSNAVFFVFSDDILWCRKKFVGEEYRFVDINKDEKSYLDMYLMSKCKHIIISNSTFSWWAAYLHSSNEGVNYVLAPKRWTKKGVETNTFSPKSWIYL